MPHVSLKDIALASGVSEMTVSRVLRNQPRVSAKTREIVQEHARRLGYRPDPKMQEMVHYMRFSRVHRATEVLALLWIDVKREEIYDTSLPTSAYLKRVVAGATRRAEQLGYKLEEFWCTAPGMSARRMEQILRARGITGVIIGPQLHQDRARFEMNWANFSVALMGQAKDLPHFDLVRVNNFDGVRLALTKLQEAGYRRIGFCLAEDANRITQQHWRASFLVNHPLGAEEALRLSIIEEKSALTAERMIRWIQEARPEITLHQGKIPLEWPAAFKAAGIPDYRFAILTLGPQIKAMGYSGVEQHYELWASNAVDLISGQMQRNERGIPEHPKQLLTDSQWVAGKWTQPARRKRISPVTAAAE